jgi:hypothetical protein
MNPVSCDTFVVLPPLTAHGGVVFGKNSDRPKGEVQELIYQPAQQYSPGEQLQVNYCQLHTIIATRESQGIRFVAQECDDTIQKFSQRNLRIITPLARLRF